MAIQVDKSEADKLKMYARGRKTIVQDSIVSWNKETNVLNLQTQESQHMTGYTKGMSYFYAKMTNNHY